MNRDVVADLALLCKQAAGLPGTEMVDQTKGIDLLRQNSVMRNSVMREGAQQGGAQVGGSVGKTVGGVGGAGAGLYGSIKGLARSGMGVGNKFGLGLLMTLLGGAGGGAAGRGIGRSVGSRMGGNSVPKLPWFMTQPATVESSPQITQLLSKQSELRKIAFGPALAMAASRGFGAAAKPAAKTFLGMGGKGWGKALGGTAAVGGAGALVHGYGSNAASTTVGRDWKNPYTWVNPNDRGQAFQNAQGQYNEIHDGLNKQINQAYVSGDFSGADKKQQQLSSNSYSPWSRVGGLNPFAGPSMSGALSDAKKIQTQDQAIAERIKARMTEQGNNMPPQMRAQMNAFLSQIEGRSKARLGNMPPASGGSTSPATEPNKRVSAWSFLGNRLNGGQGTDAYTDPRSGARYQLPPMNSNDYKYNPWDASALER